MQLSKFGSKFSRQSAITVLMQDLGDALHSDHPDLCMLGGGNPAFIPEAQAVFAKEMEALIDSGAFQNMVGNYDGPQGGQKFIQVLCNYLNQTFDWGIKPNNISLTNGSQNSFFYLFNALAGEMPDGSFKKILFPISPEYVGYADSGLSEDMFVSKRPTIEMLENNQFKYHVNFDELGIDKNIAALCLSRPTNPTGNVVSDHELKKLEDLAQQHKIPLIIDNAYGEPFPNVIYADASTPWNDNIVLCMSLSKLGLPGARTGIVIANQEITNTIRSLSGIITLAPNSIGSALMTRMIEDGEMWHLTQEVVKPFYQARLQTALELFDSIFKELPVFIHKPEGAFFLWFWIQGLPITSNEFYKRLKKRKVLVIPGESFFIDIDSNWQHTQECLRINYAQPTDRLELGFKILAEELEKLDFKK
ncbi:MAG: valine--pyruvate transaminase [Acidiferrobacterales bacterium]|nr:valine--pyruvate transaminase [Acidiferrobacterales bacterium]